MTQNKRLKVRLYPNIKQQEMLQQHFNAHRFAFNLCLEYKIKMYQWYGINVSGYDMQNELFEIRKESDWLVKCKAECIRQAALDVDSTFKKFFKGSGFPKFKKKSGRQSFTANQSIKIKNGKLSFFKHLLKFKTSEEYLEKLTNSKIKQCTFIKTPSGKYFASLLIEDVTKERPLTKNAGVVGIDLGLSCFLTTSEGECIDNPRYYVTTLPKLRKEQRKLSRKQKGSNNYEKQRIKVARLYERVTNQRTHFFHEVSNRLIRENQTIVCETLNVKGMVKNRKLSKAISDVSWGTFTSILKYKCEWYGREFIQADMFYPSSKTCSNCGCKKTELKLSERTYTCECCNVSINRDTNAALNLRNIGVKDSELTLVETNSLERRGSKSLLFNLLNN